MKKGVERGLDVHFGSFIFLFHVCSWDIYYVGLAEIKQIASN